MFPDLFINLVPIIQLFYAKNSTVVLFLTSKKGNNKIDIYGDIDKYIHIIKELKLAVLVMYNYLPICKPNYCRPRFSDIFLVVLAFLFYCFFCIFFVFFWLGFFLASSSLSFSFPFSFAAAALPFALL